MATNSHRSLKTHRRSVSRLVRRFGPLLAIAVVAGTLLHVLRNAPPTVRSMVSTSSESRQLELAFQLTTWLKSGGRFPLTLTSLAAACPPADAAHAAMRSMTNTSKPYVVVDIGANRGHPVTLGALKAGAAVVLSVEPDSRNFVDLEKRAHRLASHGTRFVGVRGAAGDQDKTKEMLFHSGRDDFSCFHCLDKRKKEVFSQQVRVRTLDTLLSDAQIGDSEEITLLKTDTQGFELEVLRGARGAFTRGVVASILVEFDPKLLHTKDNAVQVVQMLSGYGMSCMHLAFSGRKLKRPTTALFADLPISSQNAEAFYNFVVRTGGWTDLFCIRPPA